jgi:hypothetical protein
MKGAWKVVGLSLLLATLLGTLTAQSPAMLSASEKPAGCHDHGKNGPAPLPVDNHRCCIAGHDSAMVRPSAAIRPMLQGSFDVGIAIALSPQSLAAVIDHTCTSSAAPPGAIPLRI